MKLRFSGFTTKGERFRNEDAFLAGGEVFADDQRDITCPVRDFDVGEAPLCFALADGMGGQEAGEVAARLALSLLSDAVAALGPGEADEESLRRLILEIHRSVSERGVESGKPSMGCTLTGCLFSGGAPWVFNVGDSRTYHLRGGFALQVTRDHSANTLPGMEHLGRNVLYSCIGGGGYQPQIDLFPLSGRLKPGSVLLLCSDGFHEVTGDEELEKGLATGPSAAVCAELVRGALAAGSQDNVTLCALWVE